MSDGAASAMLLLLLLMVVVMMIMMVVVMVQQFLYRSTMTIRAHYIVRLGKRRRILIYCLYTQGSQFQTEQPAT